MYGSCYNDGEAITHTGSTQGGYNSDIACDRKTLYFMLVDAPYPDDRIPSSSEEAVQCRVQLECIHPISIILLHLISNDVGHLANEKKASKR